MLAISGDWKFPVDPKQSKVWLSPSGEWGIKVVCQPTQVKTAEGTRENYAPRLTIDGLHFDGSDWRELVGVEVFQHGAWRGDGDPKASLLVNEEGELYQSELRILSVAGADLMVDLKAICDVFIDEGHDTDVPLTLQVRLPFDGVHFRFRAEGSASREPEVRALELLGQYLDPESFGPPKIEALQQPGLFHAHFPPATEEEAPGADESALDLTLSTELRVLHQSGRELLSGMVQLEWLELEGSITPAFVEAFVNELEKGGRGSQRAERVAEWLLERDEVAEVHCNDDELGELLDKWW